MVRIANEYFFMLGVLITLVKHRSEYDLIHGHQANWIAVACALGGDVVHKPVLIKDATLDGFSTLASVRLGKKARTFVLERCHFVAISSDIRKNLLSYGIQQERVSYCPNGVERMDGGWVMPIGTRHILFVGNFWQGPIKGLDVLILAMKEIVGNIESAQLTVAGEGNPSSHAEMISNLGLQERIRFVGVLDDIRSLFAQASVFVLPSRQEGMSNVLLEAMAFGMPVIATKVSGSVDLIQDNVNGLLVPASDANALAKAIMRLLEDPETAIRLGVNARQTIEQKFAMDRVARQYRSLYQMIAQPMKP